MRAEHSLRDGVHPIQGKILGYKSLRSKDDARVVYCVFWGVQLKYSLPAIANHEEISGKDFNYLVFNISIVNGTSNLYFLKQFL